MNNPVLNSQRASVRAIDENVPQALGGYRPKVSATANIGVQSLSTTEREIASTTPLGSAASYFTQSGHNTPHGYGATITQSLYNGFQTTNRTRVAESQVLAARANLFATEQTVLLNAVTAYANLLRDGAILDLQRINVSVLEEQLNQTKQRLEQGSVTATDVSQAESRLSAARTQVFVAEAAYQGSRSVFRQTVGLEPSRVEPASPVDRYLPRSLPEALALATNLHPNVAAAQFNADAAAIQVKVLEGALLPSVTLQGNVQKSYESTLILPETFSASVVGQLTVPIYQGGTEYAAIRQAKETQGQKRIDLDVARDQVRSTAGQAWAQHAAAIQSIKSTQAQMRAAEAALNGVREEARLGQRTTLDVLNAQQELVNARIAAVSAQRDRLVQSYTALAAVGKLGAQVLGLNVPAYEPQLHYQQVRDAWAGTRTPDGR
jgi:outer membrane protein